MNYEAGEAGVEPATFGSKGRCSSTELLPNITKKLHIGVKEYMSAIRINMFSRDDNLKIAIESLILQLSCKR